MLDYLAFLLPIWKLRQPQEKASSDYMMGQRLVDILLVELVVLAPVVQVELAEIKVVREPAEQVV